MRSCSSLRFVPTAIFSPFDANKILQIIEVDDNLHLEKPLSYTDAILTNLDNHVYSKATFILPSMIPCARSSSYRIAFNDSLDVCNIYLRGAAPNADVLAQAISLLHRTLSDNSECADGVPVQVQAKSIETLDLDATFGLGATDLDDEDDDGLEPFHHLNLLGNPVYHKSSTPPEVSLWLAFTAHKKWIFPSFSRQGVIASQATKLVDPFMYSGSEDLLQYSGSELRNSVVGLVHKAYTDEGAWRSDRYDEDEPVPKTSGVDKGYVYDHRDATGGLQGPHWMSRDDCDDTIVNDGKGSPPPQSTRRNPDEASTYTPSKLSIVESADYYSLEAEAEEPCSQLPKKASAVLGSEEVDEEITVISSQADEHIEYVSESSYEEDTTDHTLTWKTRPKPAENPRAEYLARWSEDNDDSASITQWLESSDELHEQEDVTSVPEEGQECISSDIKLDQQVKNGVFVFNPAAVCFSPTSDAKPLLVVAHSGNDGHESTTEAAKESNDPSPLSSPFSTHFVSTNSSVSSESMAERDQKDDDALPKLDGTDPKLEPSACKEIAFSPAEESGSGYSEVFATCDLINKHIGEEAASRKDVSVDLGALESSLDPKVDFHTTCDEEAENPSEEFLQGTCALPPMYTNEQATNVDRISRVRPERDPIETRFQRDVLWTRCDRSGP